MRDLVTFESLEFAPDLKTYRDPRGSRHRVDPKVDVAQAFRDAATLRRVLGRCQ